MSEWKLRLELGASGSEPVFVRIARGISDAIAAGRVRPGERLPGSRSLAADLGVHRNTVIAAYDELTAQGWVEGIHGRGTFVCDDLPDTRERRAASEEARATPAARPGYPLPRRRDVAVSARPAVPLDLSRGVPDLRLVPVELVARAYRRVLGRRGAALLDYGDPRGALRLRTAIADMLRATRGLAAGADSLLVTRGSQMAIHLAARALVRPGELVAVESFGYQQAWHALRDAGAVLAPVPVDAQGLSTDRLAALCRRRRVRAVYLTPHHQYPTLAVLSPARRLELLELARRHRFAVIEDDYDNEFHYGGRPVLPLASADRHGSVIYVGSLSKVLAPALRVGYLSAPPPLVERLAALRDIADGGGDPALEHAVAELFEDGEVQRHARRMRRVYQQRRAVLAAALERELGDALRFSLPAGGMALWATAARGIDVDAWAARALARGVRVGTAREFAFDRRPRPHLRLAFAARTEPELRRAAQLLAATLRRGTLPTP